LNGYTIRKPEEKIGWDHFVPVENSTVIKVIAGTES